MTDPWAFAWTQLFTLVGFAITIAIALFSFRTFGRWRREKLEEKRIEIGLDALALAYEAKTVFDGIRSPATFHYECEDMPEEPGEPDERRRRRGTFYAILKRVGRERGYFEKVWAMQPRCMAVFGSQIEETFLLVQRARRRVEVSAQMLIDDVREPLRGHDNVKLRTRCEVDIWGMERPDTPDEVGRLLDQFRKEIEQKCRPAIARQFRTRDESFWSWIRNRT